MIFRARVEDTNDPLNLGRVKVRVFGYHDNIDVKDLPWAEPCLPLGGDKEYGVFVVPYIGSTVWVTFESDDMLNLDPNCPVWLGTWYGIGEPPSESDRERKIVVKSKGGHKIIINDGSKEGILIEDKNGNKIEIDTESGDMNFYTSGNITIEAGGLISIKGARIDLNEE